MTKKECCEICANEKQSAYLTRVALREDAISKLKMQNPRLAEIDKLISSVGAKTALAAISGNKKELERIKKTISALDRERAEIFQNAGIADVEYSCKKCCDTGYVDGKFCDCVNLAAREMRNEVEGFNVADNGLRLRILNELLLVEAARTLEDGGTFLPRNGSVVQLVCEWISDHLDSRFSIDDLVRLSGYGRSRFFTLFVEERGMTPNDYVVRQRIERAQKLLRKDERSILEVALACGFKSASTFSATFAKFTGVSPRAFRNGDT